MSSDWQEYRLGDITHWASGGTPSKQNPEYWGGSIPWISASSMKSKVCANSDERITEEAVRSGARMCDPGTILLLVRGSELHKRIPIGVATKRVAFNQDVKAITTRSGDLSGDYLYYLLKGSEEFLLNSVEFTGIGAGKLETPFLQDLVFPIPTREEQVLITDFMIALDDKIELNRKTNETLEAMAKALFKSWFMDFDPVRAKSEGRPTGLPAEISDLFPDSFEDSELGDIPSGWSVRKLRDFIKPVKERQGDRNIEEYSATVTGIEPRDSRFKKNLSSSGGKNKVALEGDLVFGLSRRTINFGRMAQPIGAFSSVYEVFRSTPGSTISTKIVEQCIRSRISEFMVILKPAAREGQAIDRELLLEQLIADFPEQVNAQLEILLEPVSKRIELTSEHIFALAQLRDALLPKLISGEIRIPDAEKILEEVGV